jgi:hypothetical protein
VDVRSNEQPKPLSMNPNFLDRLVRILTHDFFYDERGA